jgi:dolichyl-phosphate-mannose-protein mannosyltransferase
LTWAAHYLPFFIMGRQLFLHHYLPAHLTSALVVGALLEFIFNVEPLSEEELSGKKKKDGASTRRPIRERIGSQSLLGAWAATGAIVIILAGTYVFFAPLTYGTPSLSVEGVNARKWLTYDLHFAK